MSVTDKQIALMRDIRMKGAIDGLLFSPHRTAGPGLREGGYLDGRGDSTCLSAKGLAALAEADAKLKPARDIYRGWTISWGYGRYTAMSPNYDASWEGEEDGWVSNGQCVEARTREAVCAEIDAWFEENPCTACDGDGRVWNNADPTSGQFHACECAKGGAE